MPRAASKSRPITGYKTAARMACPHCQSLAKTVKTKRLDAAHRSQIFECTNSECGFKFEALNEIYRVIKKTKKPNPELVQQYPFLGAVGTRKQHA